MGVIRTDVLQCVVTVCNSFWIVMLRWNLEFASSADSSYKTTCAGKKTGVGRTIYLFTDGEENCWEGELTLGRDESGAEKVVDISFCGDHDAASGRVRGTPEILADYLQAAGVTVCILGIGGAAAKPMVTQMLGRRNVFCGHVDHGADTRSAVSRMSISIQ